MVEHRDRIVEHVLSVLGDADEPLSVGRLQRRIAGEGFDVATGALREVCDELEADGDIENVGDPARKYRLAE
jgi:repressor of nif and glnA expression